MLKKKQTKYSNDIEMCSFIELDKTEDRGVQRTAATPHSSASRKLGTGANSETGVNIHASGESKEHQEQNEAETGGSRCFVLLLMLPRCCCLLRFGAQASHSASFSKQNPNKINKKLRS